MKMWMKQGMAVLVMVALVATGAYAANLQSDQMTNEIGTFPPVKTGSQYLGMVQKRCWTYTTNSTTGPAVGDTIALVPIATGSRILGIDIVTEAQQPSSTMDIGYSGTGTRYGTTISMSSAANLRAATTVGTNYGDIVATNSMLLATVKGVQWAAGAKFYGCLEFQR